MTRQFKKITVQNVYFDRTTTAMSSLNVVTTLTYDPLGVPNGCFLLIIDERGYIVNIPKIKKVKGLGKTYNTNKFVGPDGKLYTVCWASDGFTDKQITEVEKIVAEANVTPPKHATIELANKDKLGGPFRDDDISLLNNDPTFDAIKMKLEQNCPVTDEEKEDKSKAVAPATPEWSEDQNLQGLKCWPVVSQQATKNSVRPGKIMGMLLSHPDFMKIMNDDAMLEKSISTAIREYKEYQERVTKNALDLF